MLLIEPGKHTHKFSTSQIRLSFNTLSKLLCVRVDALAGPSRDMLCDPAPVFAVKTDCLQKALMLLIIPVAVSLARLVLNSYAHNRRCSAYSSDLLLSFDLLF